MKERTIDMVMRVAKERGLNSTEVAKVMGIGKQTLTNWKTRGLPPAMNQKAADFIGCTIDELLGRPSPPRGVADARPMYGFGLTADGAHVGAEWQKLDEPLKSQILTLIETLVARQKREARSRAGARDPARNSA